jgi:hypothetical protein
MQLDVMLTCSAGIPTLVFSGMVESDRMDLGSTGTSALMTGLRGRMDSGNGDGVRYSDDAAGSSSNIATLCS